MQPLFYTISSIQFSAMPVGSSPADVQAVTDWVTSLGGKCTNVSGFLQISSSRGVFTALSTDMVCNLPHTSIFWVVPHELFVQYFQSLS